jgi:hypothetical protein
VISGSYTKGSVRMVKMRFSTCLAGDEITTHGCRALIFIKSTTIMIAELTVKSGLGSSRD